MKNNPYVNYEDVAKAAVETHKTNNASHLNEKDNNNDNNNNVAFMRKGQVGGWKTELSLDLIERFDKWNIEQGIDGLYQ